MMRSGAQRARRRAAVGLAACLTAALLVPAAAAPVDVQRPTTRQMNLIDWQEFAALVPEHIETVLIPVGTLEAHGVLPNGSDNLAPQAMAAELAPALSALVAPTLNYGITGDLDAFPGSLSISEPAYEAFVEDLLAGLADNGFLNLVVLNGHGGPQTAVLRRVAERVGRQRRVRTLVLNWWTIADPVTREVFGEDGGHAGNNESAYVQAIVPEHVHPDRYDAAMATPGAAGWSAYPFPSSIVLYQPGQGYPDFDPARAATYYDRVNALMTEVIADTIAKWEAAGIFR